MLDAGTIQTLRNVSLLQTGRTAPWIIPVPFNNSGRPLSVFGVTLVYGLRDKDALILDAASAMNMIESTRRDEI